MIRQTLHLTEYVDDDLVSQHTVILYAFIKEVCYLYNFFGQLE
jgi:hypothetical protein